jgi:hypothetical protein
MINEFSECRETKDGTGGEKLPTPYSLKDQMNSILHESTDSIAAQNEVLLAERRRDNDLAKEEKLNELRTRFSELLSKLSVHYPEVAQSKESSVDAMIRETKSIKHYRVFLHHIEVMEKWIEVAPSKSKLKYDRFVMIWTEY